MRRSILFHSVTLSDRSLVEDSVILPNVKIGRHVTVRRCIIDKRCVLSDGFSVGVDPAQDRTRFHVTERGVCLVTPAMLRAL